MEAISLTYVVDIVKCCQDLLRLPNLEPSAEVNGVFKRLVSLCSLVLDESVVNAVRVHPR